MTVSTAPDWMDTTPLLNDLKSLLNGKLKDGYYMWPAMEQLVKSQDVDRYALLPLFLVFEQAVQDTARFIQQAHNEITKIVSYIPTLTSFWLTSCRVDFC
jgi:hypothetical protein